MAYKNAYHNRSQLPRLITWKSELKFNSLTTLRDMDGSSNTQTFSSMMTGKISIQSWFLWQKITTSFELHETAIVFKFIC